jgi:hypothetical protein
MIFMYDPHQRYAIQAICIESYIKCVWITEDMPEHEVNGDCTYEEMPCVCHSKKWQLAFKLNKIIGRSYSRKNVDQRYVSFFFAGYATPRRTKKTSWVSRIPSQIRSRRNDSGSLHHE